MIHALILAAASGSFAPTAEGAALKSVGFRSAPIVVRVNRAGRYAAVLTRGGIMEGSPMKDAILVEHFAFGWQALDVLNFRCRLYTHKLRAAENAALLRGMPPFTQMDRNCGDGRDVGPPARVAQVRALMRGPLVPIVVISHDWALGDWYGAGGGQDLFHWVGGRWKFVEDGGGEMDYGILRSHGVPHADDCVFFPRDPRC